MKYEKTTKRRLLNRVDAFLREHRSGDGGWAKISTADVADLYEIIRDLLSLKCDPDADGDLPVDVRLTNRVLFESLIYCPDIPYTYKAGDVGSLLDSARSVASVIDGASSRMRTILREIDELRRNEKGRDDPK